MNDRGVLVSKVLVMDSSKACRDQIKVFCEANNLVGLKAQEGSILPVLKSNVDLGGILLSESYGGSADGGIALAREIHQVRPELPIFLRRESISDANKLSARDENLFSAMYSIDDMAGLQAAIDASIFGQVYPNVLVRGIRELTIAALHSQFHDVSIEVDTPYLVRDRIIFGEIFTMIPLESNWCRGYMMLQVEEDPLVQMASSNRASATGSNGGENDGGNDFRHINNVLGEATNLIWGAFKNRYIGDPSGVRNLTQLPIIVNHLHRYISFGSEDPQLCFKYVLSRQDGKDTVPLVIYQRFVFNLSWSPDDFTENPVSVETLCESGELELF